MTNSHKSSVVVKNEPPSEKFDVYCFGLAILEVLLSSGADKSDFRKVLKLIEAGFQTKVLNLI